MPILLSRLLLGAASALTLSATPSLAQDYIQPSGMTQAQDQPANATPTAPVPTGQPVKTEAPVSARPDAAPPVSADPVSDLLRQRGETYRRAGDERQDPEEVRTTSALNAEIAAQNALADNADAAANADYDAVQRRYQDEAAAAEAARLRYEDESRAAEAARVRYEQDRAVWEATTRRRAPTAYPDRPLPPGQPVG